MTNKHYTSHKLPRTTISMDHSICDIHLPIYKILIKLIKRAMYNIQQITHRIEWKHTRNNAQYPLCKRQLTIHLQHAMCKVQYYAVCNIQCTLHNIQGMLHNTFYYFKFKLLTNRKIYRVNTHGIHYPMDNIQHTIKYTIHNIQTIDIQYYA